MIEGLVLEELKRIHRDIELDAGKDPDLVADDVRPLESLGGFDSLLIPNVIRELAKAVGRTLKKGERLRNPYVGPDKRTLTLRDVAKRFCDIYSKKRKP